MSVGSMPLADRARVHSFRGDASSTRGNLFCLAGAGANQSQFADLAQACAERWQVHAFHAFDFDSNAAAPAMQAANIAEVFTHVMRKVAAPPYRLLGHSAGAFVAYELACRLEPQEWVQLLIVDSYLPSPGAPLLDTTADAQRALWAFVSVMAEQIPALADARRRLHDVTWDEAPLYLSRALREQGLFLPPRDIAARMAHFRSYTGFSFRPQGRLLGNRSHLVLASDPTFIEQGNERRCEQWQAGFDGPLTVHCLLGDHFSLLRRPQVDALAALIG